MVADNYEWFRDLNVSERFEGHELVLKEHCIPFDESLTADGLPGEPGGYIAMKRLLEKAIPPPFLLPTM